MKKTWFGKKQVVMALMVTALGLAVYLNYYMAANAPATAPEEANTVATTTRALGESQFVSSPTASENEDYFATARRTREEARQEALDIVQETLQDLKADENMKQTAVATAAAAANAVERENAIESLIKAKGFEDCVVYIHGDQCHAVVKAAALAANEALQITEIITGQASIPAENINIVAVEN